MPRGYSRYDEAALQQQLWTPATRIGQSLLLWADCSSLSTIRQNGFGGVTNWLDKGPLGNHLVTVGSQQPPILPAGPAGRPEILTLGSNVSFNAPITAYTGTTLHGYFVVSFDGSLAASNGRLLGGVNTLGDADYSNINFFTCLRSGTSSDFTIIRGGVSGATVAMPSGLCLLEVIFDGANMWVALNGADSSKTTMTSAFNFGILLSGFDGFNSGWGGFLNETVVDVAPYSARRRGIIASYLAWKWNLGPMKHAFALNSRPPLIGD